MRKAKTTIEIAKECGAKIFKNGELVVIADDGISGNGEKFIHLFRKACIADYVSQCKQVAWVSPLLYGSEVTFTKPVEPTEECERVEWYCYPLHRLPNDGE